MTGASNECVRAWSSAPRRRGCIGYVLRLGAAGGVVGDDPGGASKWPRSSRLAALGQPDLRHVARTEIIGGVRAVGEPISVGTQPGDTALARTLGCRRPTVMASVKIWSLLES